MDKQVKKQGKGTSRETAINNLKKAWAKRKEDKSVSTCTNKTSRDLSSPDTCTPEQVKDLHVEISTSILNRLGIHVERLASMASEDKLLKNAYGFKSLCDTYQNMSKLVYPYGLHASTSDHMNHMFASIMPSLQKMLTVNINVGPGIANASPIPVRNKDHVPAQVIDIPGESAGMSIANAKNVPAEGE